MLVPPSYRKVNPADAPVVLLTLSGGDKPLYYLNDIVSTIVSPALSRVRAWPRCRPSANSSMPCGSGWTPTGSPAWGWPSTPR